MDMNKLVSVLDREEFGKLRSAVWDRDRRESEIEAENLHLDNHEEWLLFSGEKIKAITELRVRVGCSLHCAKIVADRAEKEQEEHRILNNNKNFGLDGR
jgi:ribosomal protein L7/L12